MTVKELIKELQKLPQNATVITQGYYDNSYIVRSDATKIEAVKGQKNGCVFVKITGEYGSIDANYCENIWTETDEAHKTAAWREHFDTLFLKEYY